ncbi:ATP phosphoribosyltransferase regulatory subunit [Sporosarcina siberiensis]|uniref:ATP phosphoribosyltransferase regulatory subunit n=1 Tax=Sporosarcina siberiensis TaxID=1365606 RepID=A0ABW4SH27_9BACL
MSTNYRMNDENVKAFEKHDRIIKTINKRFLTYGYKRIKTSTFEQYDLYSKVNGAINQNEMIKVIDYTGQVLVLRPDVTIPITRKLAEDFSELPNELRYFYVQDVFRQSFDKIKGIESTQAGVEYFCKSSPEADAEVIALACDTLKDLGFIDIKIEIGHAGFFKELVEQIHLTDNQLNQLKNRIQAKSVVDIESFLSGLNIDEKLKDAISMIPFLYGNSIEVSERAKKISFTEKMNEKLDYLLKVYELLIAYGLEDNIVMDLGLINHMGYYSDLMFQGFVEKYGKPVLMGGRYDELGNEFDATLPAIGFACEVDSLVEASENQIRKPSVLEDVEVYYESTCFGRALTLVKDLRERNYSVLSYPMDKKQLCSVWIQVTNEQFVFHNNGIETSFTHITELLKLLSDFEGEK